MITYEWTIEVLEGPEDDIVDNDFYDAVPGALVRVLKAASALQAEGKRIEVGLVRDTWNKLDGDLDDRQWAYLEDGVLPARFDGGAKVPARFLKEISPLAV